MVTNELKSVIIPSATVSKLLWRNFGMLTVAAMLMYAAAFIIVRILGVNQRV